jgi:hypothetical protein
VKSARSTPERAAAPPGNAADRLADPHLRPQLTDDMRPTRLGRTHEREPLRCPAPKPLLTAQETLDRTHEPHQRLPVELILAAEVVDHPRDRHPALAALLGASCR